MPKKPLRMAVVSCGAIAQAHLRGIAACEDAELVAVVSRDEARRQKAAETFGAKRSCADFEEVLKDDEVDAVVICSPNFLHFPCAMEALQAGKHVLTEKPVADSYADGVTLVEEAERRGLRLMSSQNTRYLAAMRKAREILISGEMGRPLHLLYTLTGWYEGPASWWKDCKRFLIANSGSHPLDFFPWMTGAKPARVYATAHSNKPNFPGEDDFCVHLTLDNGAHAITYTTINSRFSRRDMVIVCEKGTLFLDGLRTLSRDGEVLVEGGPDPFVEQMREFVSAALEGRAPGNSGRDVLPSLAVIDAAYRSVEECRAVALRQDEGGRWEIQ
ncbi:MAG: Gfo/Idh/MocA family oxidoreductase [Candidatus Latescibacteria bacterium]|nr:Gfo/Idh/MocA family oxidoreductase [Candidatus Latescibacterota bacterium]